jgi:anti-sigma-K factor RskA
MTQIHEGTGSYALNALEAAQRAEFEAHLATCQICRDEVADFCDLAAELSVLTSADPPAGLRGTLLDTIRTTAQVAAPAAPEVVAAPVPTNGSRPAEQSVGAAPTGAPRRALVEAARASDPLPASAGPQPEVDELAVRRQFRRSRVLSSLVAAMLALALGLGGVVYSLVQQRQAQVASVTLEEQLYAAPDARTVTVPLESGGQVTFIASKQLNRALFLGTGLPDPGPENRYQLWTGTGDPTAENGITGVARDNQVADTGPGSKLYFTGDVAGADFLAVNVEPAGSTPAAPTNPVLAAGVI